jgi:hypothetical protein
MSDRHTRLVVEHRRTGMSAVTAGYLLCIPKNIATR